MSAAAPRYEDWAPVLDADGYSEVFLEAVRGVSLVYEDSRVSESSCHGDSGAGLRYLFKREDGEIETLFGSVNGLEPLAARALAGRLLRGRTRRAPPPAPVRRQTLLKKAKDFSAIETAVAALFDRIDLDVRRRSPRAAQVRMSYSARSGLRSVFDSEGGALTGPRDDSSFAVAVTVSDGRALQQAHESVDGEDPLHPRTAALYLRAAREAARLAERKLDAPPARAGEYPVVLAARAGGTFVHEAIGHSLEADHIQSGSSPVFAGRLGRQVAPEFLSIMDDPTLPLARGSYDFDDEGEAARPTVLVKNGTLADFLYDRLTALGEGRRSNGHGRRESYKHRPCPRLSNLYIAPGPHDPRNMLAELEEGLYVTKIGGGEVHTATGEFAFHAEEAFLLEGGTLRGRVRDATLFGVGAEALASIDRLGFDIGWSGGLCGKNGQGVPVCDGQPTLRIPRLLVGGRT